MIDHNNFDYAFGLIMATGVINACWLGLLFISGDIIFGYICLIFNIVLVFGAIKNYSFESKEVAK